MIKDEIKCFFDKFVVLWDEVTVLHDSSMEVVKDKYKSKQR